MLKIKVRLNFDPCLVALATIILASLTAAAATDYDEYSETYDPNSLVEVHLKADPNAAYVEKKTNWSWRFSSSYEAFSPDSYISPLDQASYKTIFGSNQGSILTGSFGAQYNTKNGAIYLDGQYGAGSIAAGKGSADLLKISKYGATIGFMLDALVKDPWASPYIAGQVVSFNWLESAATGTKGGTTAITTGLIAGVSIHLNKIDQDAARDAYMSYGMKNTFLDIYGVQYNTSGNASDPDLQTEMNFGAGFHFEF